MKREHRKIILIQDNDWKSKSWSRAASFYEDSDVVPLSNSPIFLAGTLVLRIVFGRRVILGYCFRYLNDYPSFFKSVLRAFSEAVSLIILKATRKKVLWICHNLDRESHQNYPVLSKFRRKLIEKFADQVYVTDELLVDEARKYLDSKDLKVCTFGGPSEVDFKGGEDLPRDVSEWIVNAKLNRNNPCFGLWIGDESIKNIDGLEFLLSLSELSSDRLPVCYVIIGPMSKILEKERPELLEKILSSPYIYAKFDYIRFSVDCWNKYFNFVVKSLPDVSVAYTLYNAAHARLPVLTDKRGFLSKVVSHYEIGASLDGDVDEFLLFLQRLDENVWGFDDFNRSHSWALGAKRLVESVTSHSNNDRSL